MSQSPFYLEHYLDSLETLPGELRRNFTKMTDKDVMNKDIMVQIDGASDEYLRKVRDLSPTKRKAEMEKIQHMFKKAKELSDEKVNIAVATYEMIDKHIRKLDSDLAKFESEMKVVFNLLPLAFSPLCPGQRPAVADGERGGGGGE